jgi:hypothetical protein
MARCATVELAICLACGACGRIGFDGLASDGGSLPATPDAALGAVQSRIAYVGTFAKRKADAGAMDVFTGRAQAAGDAVLLQVSCGATTAPSDVAIDAPGWPFVLLGPLTSSASQSSATFAAIAPDPDLVSIMVIWSGGSGCDFSTNDLGDEFAMADPAGGTTTFDNSNMVAGTGNCTGSVVTGHADDAVWAACNTAGNMTDPGDGFSPATADDAGDLSEFKITDDGANHSELVQFSNPSGREYVLSMVTLKPQ